MIMRTIFKLKDTEIILKDNLCHAIQYQQGDQKILILVFNKDLHVDSGAIYNDIYVYYKVLYNGSFKKELKQLRKNKGKLDKYSSLNVEVFRQDDDYGVILLNHLIRILNQVLHNISKKRDIDQ